MATHEVKRQTLVFDGDDTLWENNVYFERAIDDFIGWLDHSTLSPREVRAVIDDVEHANIDVHGYGALALGQSLHEVSVRLRDRQLDDDERETVLGFAAPILTQPMELIAGVEPTLRDLAPHHDLALLTKGHAEEQRLKIDRSGIGRYFDQLFVVPEKDAAVYRDVLVRLGSDAAATWMIGNSPRSDINPALAAGLSAIFIPHDQTWRLEHQDLDPTPDGQRLLILKRFTELGPLFSHSASGSADLTGGAL